MATDDQHNSHDENVRDLEQIRHTNDTITQDHRLLTEAANIQIVTPNYKSGDKPDSEVKHGLSASDRKTKFSNRENNYEEHVQEQVRMQIIDPKVDSNANLPVHAPSDYSHKKLIEDFPSLHGKRSFLNLDSMQQRSIRNTKPITTSKYLTESVDRHRDVENSDLKKYLKAREEDANKPWNKPDWPGPKKDDENLRELDKLRQSLNALQKNAREPKSFHELDELARLNCELTHRSKKRQSDYKIQISKIINKESASSLSNSKNIISPISTTWQTDFPATSCSLSPQSMRSMKNKILKNNCLNDFQYENGLLKRFSSELFKSSTSNIKNFDSDNQQKFSNNSKMQKILSKEPLPVVRTVVHHEPTKIQQNTKPNVKKTVQRFEENKRTEEVERRIIRRERRHKSHRTRYVHGNNGIRYPENPSWNMRGLRSNSAASRNELNDYNYHNSSRMNKEFFNEGFSNKHRDNVRYGSLSNSLRLGNLKYGPNGELHENDGTNSTYSTTKRVNKSYSSRNVHNKHSSLHNGHSPFVEFPPTLPRHVVHYYDGPPAIPPHQSSNNGGLTKSRSYADWDEGRGLFGNTHRRYDDDMRRLENEFRDSLLMRLSTNNGNMHEKSYRHELIPGGYETYEREVKASHRHKLNPEGLPTNINESSHEYNYNRKSHR